MNAFFEAISKQKYEGKKMVIANYDDDDEEDDKGDDKSDDDRHIKNRLQVGPRPPRRPRGLSLTTAGSGRPTRTRTCRRRTKTTKAPAVTNPPPPPLFLLVVCRQMLGLGGRSSGCV